MFRSPLGPSTPPRVGLQQVLCVLSSIRPEPQEGGRAERELWHELAQTRCHGRGRRGGPRTVKGPRALEQTSPQHAPGRKWPPEHPGALLTFVTLAFTRRRGHRGPDL